jgi:hypothetical protein
MISNNQSGCLKGRSIFSNIRSTIDIINHTNEKNIHGILLFVDYEKAFDTVNLNFVYKCLEKMNFGEYFRKSFATMYADIQTCTLNNGHASQFFHPTRGIRQGCPISANLFILIVEILAHAVRKNHRINGIILDNVEYKITQYADDTCLYLSDQESLQAALIVFEMFTKCSGLKVNNDKSEAIWIGASSNFRHKPFNLKWTNGPVKSLGLLLFSDMQDTCDQNFNEQITKIENILQLWCLRNTTLKGKVVVVNT